MTSPCLHLLLHLLVCPLLFSTFSSALFSSFFPLNRGTKCLWWFGGASRLRIVSDCRHHAITKPPSSHHPPNLESPHTSLLPSLVFAGRRGVRGGEAARQGQSHSSRWDVLGGRVFPPWARPYFCSPPPRSPSFFFQVGVSVGIFFFTICGKKSNYDRVGVSVEGWGGSVCTVTVQSAAFRRVCGRPAARCGKTLPVCPRKRFLSAPVFSCQA